MGIHFSHLLFMDGSLKDITNHIMLPVSAGHIYLHRLLLLEAVVEKL